jgi:hypothetical protein
MVTEGLKLMSWGGVVSEIYEAMLSAAPEYKGEKE